MQPMKPARSAADACVADKGDYFELNPSEPQYKGIDDPSPPSSQPIDE